MRRIEIGYLCRKGHYAFYSDPEEDGQCGAPGVGRVWLEIEPEWDEDAEGEERTDQIIWEADDSLAEKFTTWRAS